jgi:hypothetical protein
MRWQRTDDSREEVEALKLAGFFAGFEEDLQAQAKSQEGYATMDGVDQRGAKIFFVEGANESGVMADTGEEQGFRIGNGFGRIGAMRFSS